MGMEAEIEKIKERNAKVEADKAWETSYARRIIITISTYALSLIVFIIIEANNPHLAALIPSLAYLLSTVTLPSLKAIWLKSRK
jgi:hypothetical protein